MSNMTADDGERSRTEGGRAVVSRPWLRLLLLAVLLLPATLAACSEATSHQTVDVTLDEFRISVNPPIVSADPLFGNEIAVAVTVNNSGDETHQLVVVKVWAEDWRGQIGPVPRRSDGSLDEGADGIDVTGATHEVESGESDSWVLNLADGNYLLLCNRVEGGESHFQRGMWTEFGVSIEREWLMPAGDTGRLTTQTHQGSIPPPDSTSSGSPLQTVSAHWPGGASHLLRTDLWRVRTAFAAGRE